MKFNLSRPVPLCPHYLNRTSKVLQSENKAFVSQIFVAVLSMTLNFLRDCRLHLQHYRNSALTINYISLASVFIITVLNVVISAFDPAIVGLN